MVFDFEEEDFQEYMRFVVGFPLYKYRQEGETKQDIEDRIDTIIELMPAMELIGFLIEFGNMSKQERENHKLNTHKFLTIIK